MRDIANRPPDDARRQSLRQATAQAVQRSKEVLDARQAARRAAGKPPLEPGEEPPAVQVADNLIMIGYPLAWVAEEIAYRYGNENLVDVIKHVVFLYGQSIKDLLRDAIEEGARRRAADRAEARRKARDEGVDALSAEERTMLTWEPLDWTLVRLGETPIDLRFLLPNDDPGGLTAGELRGPLASEQ
jgi:hypothetical protein